MKQLSKAWHDRPQSAMDSAVYWTEYAARHKNINLKSSAIGVPLYKYAGLDVLAVLLGLLLGFAVLLKSLWPSTSSSKISKQQSAKMKKQ